MNALDEIPIGQTGIKVTRLGLGGVFVGSHFETSASYDISLKTIKTAYDIGIKYFDTAPFYGCGRSEARFGKMLSDKPRDTYVLSTKVGRLLIPDSENPGMWEDDKITHFVPEFDLSRDGIIKSVEDSLERLGLNHVEILYLHDPDRANKEDEAIKSAFPALMELKEQGLVKAIGTGMNQWQMPMRFLQEFDLDVILLAGRYTLLDQSAYLDFLPLCEKRGTKIVTGGPFNSGILTATTFNQSTWFNYKPASAEWIEKAINLKLICDKYSVNLKAAALQFPLAHPAVACVIPGAASPAQLEENVSLINAPIPPGVWEELKYQNLIPIDAPTP